MSNYFDQAMGGAPAQPAQQPAPTKNEEPQQDSLEGVKPPRVKEVRLSVEQIVNHPDPSEKYINMKPRVEVVVEVPQGGRVEDATKRASTIASAWLLAEVDKCGRTMIEHSMRSLRTSVNATHGAYQAQAQVENTPRPTHVGTMLPQQAPHPAQQWSGQPANSNVGAPTNIDYEDDFV